jgi:hypothetical protein
MKSSSPSRLIRLLNIALLVVNITALITLLMMNKSAETTETTRDIRSVRFLQEQLDLTEGQYNEVVVMSERTFHRYNRTLEIICRTNFRLLEEMARQEPDHEEMRRLTARVGRLHANLKNLTVEYFEMVRNICTEEQNTKLASLFLDIMQLENQCEGYDMSQEELREYLNQLGRTEQTSEFD